MGGGQQVPVLIEFPFIFMNEIDTEPRGCLNIISICVMQQAWMYAPTGYYTLAGQGWNI